MADLSPPGSPNQGEADDGSSCDAVYGSSESADDVSSCDSDYGSTESAGDVSSCNAVYGSSESADDSPGTSANEENAESEDGDDFIPIREILESQKAGEFDFDRDSVIKDQEDFRRRLREYETMDDRPKPDTTIPIDSQTLRRYVGILIEAIRTRFRAIKNTNEPSRATRHLKKLKLIEIEMKCWGAIRAACEAQLRRSHSRILWGIDRLRFEDYNSLRERVEAMRETLQISEDAASALVREGLPYLQRLAASPNATLKNHSQYKKSNVRKAANTVVSNEARRLFESRQKDPSGPLNATQPLAEAFGEVLAKKPAQPLGSRRARAGGLGKNNAPPSSSTAEKQKQPSSVPRRIQAGPRNAQPTVPKDASYSAASTPTSQNDEIRRYGAQPGVLGPVARQAILRLRSNKPQPKPSAFNPFIPASVGKGLLPPVPVISPPPPRALYSATPDSTQKRRCPSPQPPEGAVKKQKRDTTRDDTHPLRRNEIEGSLGTPGGNQRSTAFPSHDSTNTSSQPPKIGSAGRKPLPDCPRHEPSPMPPMDQKYNIAKPAGNEMSPQPVLRLWPRNASRRPGQESRAPTNSLSAAAGPPSATAQTLSRRSDGLSLPRDAHPGDDPIGPFGSRDPAKKKKKKRRNPPSHTRDGASAPGARGPDAPRFRKIRKQDGNDYWCELDDYAGEGDEE